MKKRIISLLMLTLILMSTLSIAFTAKPSLAENDENGILGKDFPESFDKNQRNVFESKPDASQEETLESPSQTSRDSGDKWDFNSTSEWSKFAYIDGNKTRLIVGVDSEEPTSFLELEKIAAKHQAEIVNTVSIGGQVRAAVVELLLASVTAFVEEVHTVGLASYVEPDMKVQAQFVPNDPYWNLQWGPQKIEADWAWNTTVGDPSVLVAVVDTGIDYTHPDLAANYVALGYDWVNMDADPWDDHGHGTHCAGIIAAAINNNVGIAGLAQVRIMAEKVLNNAGGGYWDWIANGIINATDSGADIISMSLGGYSDSELVHEAVRYAYDAGVLVIAAAGNDNTNMKLYPAGYDEVIAVAATDQYDSKASFSNWGEWIELAAPGVSIHSTVPWGYESWSGTSMATPHVSGVAALVWSRYPNKTRDWVRLWLRYTANDLGDPGFDVYYGYGRINARKAVEQTPAAHEMIAYEWRTPPYVEPGALAIVNATILNFGDNDETDVSVQLLANDTVVDSTLIGSLASGNSTPVSLTWNPTVEGLYNVTLYVVPVPGETSVENNVVWKYVYVGFPLKAVVLHSAGNIQGNIITNWQVLNNEWHMFGDTMVYIDYTTLNKEVITYEDIASTEADVLIISCAYDPGMGWQFIDSEIEAIKRYVLEGHGLIATAGTLYYWVPNNNKLAPLFGMNETATWSATQTDLLHLVNTTHPIFANVPNPLVFPQVGTALPFDGRWDSNELVEGKYLALGHYQESAIVTYRGLVYISPWLEVIPAYYHHHLQLLYNAITWSRYQKPQHELGVSLEAPEALKPGQSALLNATVSNMGLSNETNVELQLLINDAIVDSTTIRELWAGDSYTLGHLWTPTIEGIYNITAYAFPVYGEDDITNNVKSVKVIVSTLIVALFQNWDPWDYPSNEEALDRYGVPYVVFRSSDFGSVDLSAFTKVVIASDQDQAFYNGVDTYRWWFEDYVNNGGILEIHAADGGWHGGRWVGPLPGGLQWASYYGQYVTVVDPTHPVLTTPNMITEAELDNWNYAVHGYFSVYPADAHIIIIEDSTRMPAYLEFGYGSGFIVASSQTLEWAYKRRLSLILENSLLYMPKKYEHDVAVTLKAPASLEPINSVLLNATVRNFGLNNETSVELQLMINGTIVNFVVIPELLVGESYRLSYLWVPTVEGTYNVTAYAPPVPGEEVMENNVATQMVRVRCAPKLLVVDTPVPEDTGVLDRLGYEYTLVSPTEFATVDLYRFNILFVGWTPGDDVVNALVARASEIAGWVAAGNGIVALSEFYESNRWAWLPLWVNSYGYTGDNVHILDPTHPVLFNLTDAELSYWSFSYHGYFYSYHADWTALAQGIEAGYSITLAATYGSGRIVITDQDPDFHFYYNDVLGAGKLLKNMIEWATPYIRYQHDLALTLEAPAFLEPDTSVMLNATVHNQGLNNETNVELQLMINSTVLNSVIVPDLLTGQSFTFSCLWTPTIGGTYNVTAYAPSVLNETYTANNVVSEMVHVRYPPRLLVVDTPWPEDTGALDMLGYNYTLVTPAEFATVDLYQYNVLFVGWSPGDAVVDALLARASEIADWVAAGNGIVALSEFYESNRWDWLPLWVNSYGFAGNNVQILDPTHPVMFSLTDAQLSNWGMSYHGFFVHHVWKALAWGIEISAPITLATTYGSGRIVITQQDPDWHLYYEDRIGAEKLLTNMIEWVILYRPPPVRYEHELVVSLRAPPRLKPNTPTILKATVYNDGLSNETGLELYLLINGSIVASAMIPELLVNSSYVLNYLWTPTVEGIYNVTAYAPPVHDEAITKNNVVMMSVQVFTVTGTYISIDPIQSIVIRDEVFTINITVTDVSDLYGYEFKLFYKNDILEGRGVTLPAGHFLTPEIDPRNIYVWINETNNAYNATHGCIHFAFSLFNYVGNETGKTGSGILVTVQFKARELGNSILDLCETILADPEGEIISHSSLDGLAEVAMTIPLMRDVAVISVVPSVTEAYAGWMISINVTAKNVGNSTETFTVTAYYESTPIETKTVFDLHTGEEMTLTFCWNTTGLQLYVNYTMWAEASVVPGETDQDNNVFIDGYVKLKMVGDVNNDKTVNILDCILASSAFGSYPSHPKWNSLADINRDNKINILDFILIANNFGNKY